MEVLSGDRGMSGVNGGEMRGLDRPAMVVRGPCDAQALVGGRVLLKATYMGHPEPKVIWNRAGHELRNDERTSITSAEGVSCLLLQDITPDDSGKYGICVENLHGADCSYASVSVEGPPYPPSGRPSVTPHPDGCGATVAWSSCPFDGGRIVTGYLVESTLAGSEVWSTVTEHCLSLSHQVRGLQPGARYVFRVRAVNVHGASTPGMESEQILMEEIDESSGESMSFEPRVVVLEPGPEFKLRFEVLEEIGKGRFGVVHKVIDRTNNQKLAAKFIKCRTTKDKDKVQDEIDIMNMLRHPKLLQLASAYENQRDIVMVTEFITGGELFERVVADDFTLTEKDCILFMRQIMEGVAYMHDQTVVHLDLKPENIMCHTRTSHQVKIIDFGLAQKLYPGQPIRVLFGTPEFAPPEIVSYEPIGVESDMWSLGVICYVLLSGLSPFMGDNDAETFANITRADYDFDDEAFNAVSQNARDFISALLIKRKEDRLSAEQCLKHTWLDPANHQETVVISTDKLKKFIIRRKWQKTGNAIRALGRMANLSASRRNSANNSASNTPRPSISDNTSRMSSLNEEELQQVSLEEPEILDNDDEITTPFSACDINRHDEVFDNNKINEHLNEITQNDMLLKIDTENVKDTDTKEIKGKVCSERSDSGFSDCSVQVTSNNGSCTSTPLLSKKFPINEEPEIESNSSSIDDVADFISEKTLVLEMSKQKQDLSSGNSVASTDSVDDSRHNGGEYSKHENCELKPKNNYCKLSSKIETYTNNCTQNKCKSASSLTSLQRLSIYSSSSVASAIKLFDHREPADGVTAQPKDPGVLKSDQNFNNHIPKKDNQVQTKFSFSSAAPVYLQNQITGSNKKTEEDKMSSPRKIVENYRKSSLPIIASSPHKETTPERINVLMDVKPVSKVDSLVQKLDSTRSSDGNVSSTVQLNTSSSFRKSKVTLPSSDLKVTRNAGKETPRKKSIVNSNTTSKPKSESFQKAAAFWNSPKT